MDKEIGCLDRSRDDTHDEFLKVPSTLDFISMLKRFSPFKGVVDGFSSSNLFFFDFLKLFSVWHPRKGCATQKRKLFGSFYFFLNIFNTRKCASLVYRSFRVPSRNSINVRFIIFDCYVKRESILF